MVTTSVGYVATSKSLQPGFLDVISTTLSGTSASQYEVVYTSGSSIKILSSFEESDPPSITSVQFNTDGNKLLIVFDSNTDQIDELAANVYCSSLFGFVGMTDLTSCQWTNASAVSVTLDSFATVGLGDIVTLLPNVVRAECYEFSTTSCDTWATSTNSSTGSSS